VFPLGVADRFAGALGFVVSGTAALAGLLGSETLAAASAAITV
jgi:hypothetical protein